MNRRKVARFPEDADRVRAFDAALFRNRSAVVDLVHQHRADWAGRKVTMLERTGFPLRPFFLRKRQVDFIASSLHDAFGRLFTRIAAQLNGIAGHRITGSAITHFTGNVG